MVFGCLDRMPAATAGSIGGITVSAPVDATRLTTFYHTRGTVLATTLLSDLATTAGLAGHFFLIGSANLVGGGQLPLRSRGTRHVRDTCLDERGEQGGRLGTPSAEVPRGGGSTEHLEQTDIRDGVSCDAEGVNGEENLEGCVQTLEVQGIVAWNEEPRGRPHEHFRGGLDTRGDFRRNPTQNRLDRTGGDGGGLGSENAEEVTTARPFPFARERIQNPAATGGEGLTEADPIDRVELVGRKSGESEWMSIRVGAPGVDEVAAALLWGSVANRGELEVAERYGRKAEIVEHRAHLVDNLDDADDGVLVEVGTRGFCADGGEDLRVVNLGRCVATGGRAEKAFREHIEQGLVGLEDGGILAGDLDCPDDTLRRAIPLAAGGGAVNGDLAMPEGAEEVGELLVEALLRPPIGRDVAG